MLHKKSACIVVFLMLSMIFTMILVGPASAGFTTSSAYTTSELTNRGKTLLEIPRVYDHLLGDLTAKGTDDHIMLSGCKMCLAQDVAVPIWLAAVQNKMSAIGYYTGLNGTDQNIQTSEQDDQGVYAPPSNDCLKVTKSVDHETAIPGEKVTYTYTIRNCGDTTATITNINDDFIGTLLSEFKNANIAQNGKTQGVDDDQLDTTESVTFTLVYEIPLDQAVNKDLTNHVAVDWKVGTKNQPTQKADATVRIVEPKICITKTAETESGPIKPGDTIYPGDEIIYHFEVENCGTADLKITGLTDTTVPSMNLGDLFGAFVTANGLQHPGQTDILKVGQTVTFNAPNIYIIPQGTSGDITNEACVDADYVDPGPEGDPNAYTYHLPVKCDIATITVSPPDPRCVKITKKIDQDPGQVFVGDTITYVYQVCNCTNQNVKPDTFITIDTLFDDVVSPVPVDLKEAFASANELQNGNVGADRYKLLYDQCATFSIPYVAQLKDVGVLKNKVTVTILEGPPDDDGASIVVKQPNNCLEVTKNVDHQTAIPGEKLTYTYKICNCGNTTATITAVTDDVVGSMLADQVPFDLDPDECKEFSVTYTVPLDQPVNQDLKNCVKVSWSANGVPQPDTDPICATVKILEPKICITKTAPTQSPIHPGDIVTYHFKVENCGTAELKVTALSDDKIGNLLAAFTAANEGSDTLAAGQFVEFDANYTVPLNASGDITNKVCVDADYVDSVVQNKYSYSLPEKCDDATITVSEPENNCLKVTKKVDHQNAIPGEKLTYTYKICNCGNTTATITAVTDDVVGSLLADQVPFDLAPDECKEFSAAYAVPSTYPVDTDLKNCVKVSWSVNGEQQSDTEPVCATVRIIKPDTCITKTPSPTQGSIGDQITYKYRITNCGETTLKVTNITDTTSSLGDLFGAFKSANQLKYGQTDILAPGQFVEFDAPNKFTIPQGASGQISNTACVYADYVDPVAQNTYNYSLPKKCVTAYVTVIQPQEQPCIDIIKTAPATAQVNDKINYKYTVCNCGNVSLVVKSLVDSNPLIGNLLDQFKQANKQQNQKNNTNADVLDPDECVTLTVPYTIKLSDPNPLNNCATVTGYVANDDGATISAMACATVNIVTPQTKVCFLPVTFTQIGWHDFCSAAPGVPGGMIYSKFPIAFARFGFYGSSFLGQVAIGAPNNKVTPGSHMITFVGKTSGLNQLCNFLPQTGPCDRLWTSYTSPSYLLTKTGLKTSNILAGETLALTLNIAYNDMRLMPRSPGYDLEKFTLTQGLLKGKTVGQVLNIANSVLAGAPPCNFGFTGSFAQGCAALVNILQNINANYEFVDINSFIDRGYLKPNRTLGLPTLPHSLMVSF